MSSERGALPGVAGGAAQDSRALRRTLAAILPAAGATLAADGAAAPLLELDRGAMEPPRLISAAPIEHERLRAVAVRGAPAPGVDAFLDGSQTSRAIAYVGGAPLVEGTAAAVVRARRERRMSTWRHVVSRGVYASRSALPLALWRDLAAAGVRLVDTDEADAESGAPPAGSAHPFILRDAAVHRVQEERERLEREMAEAWCERDAGRLFVDGGISGSERVAGSSCVLGVIKTHRTLYAEGDALRTLLALREGERSSVFRVTSARRSPVASWYLRLRDAAGRDPLWGLVRVEVALPAEQEVAARAEEVSRWVLAERAPLSLPDARWDRMAYGIRDCEEFLKAVV